MIKEPTTVTAVAATRYGGPERLGVIQTAVQPPAAGQVQIEIHAVSLNRSDLLAMRGEPFFIRLGNGLTRPRHPTPGADVAGRVLAVGPGVEGFKRGDAVVGDLSGHGRGGLAQLINVDRNVIVPLPAGLDMEAAAALPTAGVTALQALKTVAGVQSDERVLIDGASGGVGGFAIQIARTLGAHVTAVVGRGKSEIALALGAHHAVDYTTADPTDTRHVAATASTVGTVSTEPVYDVIYAVNGHRTLSDYQRVLSPNGRFVMTGGSGSLMLQTMLAGKRFRFHTMNSSPDDLTHLLNQAAAGAIVPNIVARFPFDRTAEALKFLEQGHVAGKIIVTIHKGEKNEF